MATNTPSISREATDLIVRHEVSSRAVYEKKLKSPIWPGGKSGVTIGIGYDLGHQSWEQVQSDWGSDIDLRLKDACGVVGTKAEGIAKLLSDIEIGFDDAIAVYEKLALPRYIETTISKGVFPEARSLHPHCLGVLVSLVYNRGQALEGENREEMLYIADALKEGDLAIIPTHIRAMKRIWKGRGLSGLLTRREEEARLFEYGLLVTLSIQWAQTAKLKALSISLWQSSEARPFPSDSQHGTGPFEGASGAFRQPSFGYGQTTPARTRPDAVGTEVAPGAAQLQWSIFPRWNR